MRIVGSESPSLPPLVPLLPSDQVESEEAAHLHCKDNLLHRDHIGICRDYGKERSRGPSKWADCGSRQTSHESRNAEIKSNSKIGRSSEWASYNTLGTRNPAIESCDDSWRQARSIRQNTRKQTYSPAQGDYCANGNSRSVDLREAGRKNEKMSPLRSHRSHNHQSRAALSESAVYTDTKVLEMANRSRHTSSRSSDNAYSRQSHRGKHGGTQSARFAEYTDYARHQRTQEMQLSDNKDNARHGDHRRTQDVKLAESAVNARYTKPSQPADKESHDCPTWHNRSSGHKAFRRSKENVYGEVENESNQGIDELKLETRSYSDYCKQSNDNGCIQAAGIQAEGNGDHGIDARNGTCQESISLCVTASELSKDVGTLLMRQGLNERTGDEESDTTSLQAEVGISNTLTEGQRDNVHKSSRGSNIVLEMSSRNDTEAKEDNPLDTENQYKMLASLLLDDSLDIGEDFDVMIAPGGPDLEYCGSIFDDDFELPVSMDVEAAAHVKDAICAKKEEAVHPSQPVDLQEPHLCVMRGLFQDGKDIMNHQSISSNKLVEKHAALTNTGFQTVEKQQSLQDSSKKKLTPRIFVDVTNKFEIHTASVKVEKQENDSHRLNQRQRQVEFGKNTLGYERYSELVPRCKRKPQHPQTPNPKQVCSKRSWDGQIRKWRRLLHAYDLPSEEGEEKAEDFSILKSRLGHAADAMRDATRFSTSIENKGCNASEVKIKEDANLTIYDDWMTHYT